MFKLCNDEGGVVAVSIQKKYLIRKSQEIEARESIGGGFGRVKTIMLISAENYLIHQKIESMRSAIQLSKTIKTLN